MEDLFYKYIREICVLISFGVFFLLFYRTIRDSEKQETLPWYLGPLLTLIAFVFMMIGIGISQIMKYHNLKYAPAVITDVDYDKNGYIVMYEFNDNGKLRKRGYSTFKPKCVDGKKRFERCNGIYFLAGYKPGIRYVGYILLDKQFPDFYSAQQYSDSLNSNNIIIYDSQVDLLYYHRIFKPAIKKLFGRKE